MTRAAVHAAVRRTRAGRRVTQALAVRESARFLRAAHEASPDPREYRLRRGGHVVLRHGTTDVRMFDEIVCSRAYAPPRRVVEALGEGWRPRRIVDVGANVGLFAVDAASRWPGAAVTAIEADPANLPVLERCAELNAPGGRWTVVGAAAATAPGTLRFVGGAGSESHAAHPSETAGVVEVPAVDAFEHLAEADLVKIDIEGGEWALLADPRLASSSIDVLVLEHHGRLCPSTDPRATARDLLAAAGFDTEPGGGQVLGVGTLWAWRPG